jgi:hypothetical protein
MIFTVLWIKKKEALFSAPVYSISFKKLSPICGGSSSKFSAMVAPTSA